MKTQTDGIPVKIKTFDKCYCCWDSPYWVVFGFAWKTFDIRGANHWAFRRRWYITFFIVDDFTKKRDWIPKVNQTFICQRLKMRPRHLGRWCAYVWSYDSQREWTKFLTLVDLLVLRLGHSLRIWGSMELPIVQRILFGEHLTLNPDQRV